MKDRIDDVYYLKEDTNIKERVSIPFKAAFKTPMNEKSWAPLRAEMDKYVRELTMYKAAQEDMHYRYLLSKLITWESVCNLTTFENYENLKKVIIFYDIRFEDVRWGNERKFLILYSHDKEVGRIEFESVQKIKP